MQRPDPHEMVLVMMCEANARRFEDRCLGARDTGGNSRLSMPVEIPTGLGDLPVYVVINDA